MNSSLNLKKLDSINKWWIELQDKIEINGVNIKEASIYNYLIDYNYFPWKGFEVENHIDSLGKNKIRLKSDCNTPKRDAFVGNYENKPKSNK